MLTRFDIELIRDSYTRLSSDRERVSVDFYEDLFRRHPRVRALFEADTRHQGMRFMQALGFIIDHLDAPAQLQADVARLAASHAHLDITEREYAGMLDSLMQTFRHALGFKFSSAAEAAWRKAFGEIATVMVAHAAGGKAVSSGTGTAKDQPGVHR